MITKIFLSSILLFAITSCINRQTQEKQKEEPPKALADKSESYASFSKRGYNDDMVESLYNELVSKDANLKTLENKIAELNESKSDSTNLFYKFDAKNQSYYNAADKHISGIKDSLLRGEIKAIVANNLAKYNSLTSANNELLKTIETKGLIISDLHIVLKIIRTLPVIEQYQQNTLPNTKPLEGYIKQQNETIKLADTLSKK